MDSGARNRVRLWLRSEKALGLPSVARPVAHPGEPAESFASSDEAGAETTGASVGNAAAGYDSDELTAPAPPPMVPVVMPPTSRSAPVPAAVERDALFAPAADQPAFDAPVLSSDEKRARLAAMNDKEVRGCT